MPALLRQVGRLLDSTARAQGVEFVLPEAEGRVRGDPDQLKQVFLNLCMNALQAMAEGGRLSLGLVRSDHTLRVSVEDTGTGIPAEDLDLVFDPFFTTREEGTGLGLAVCYGIVSRHEGRIDIESRPGAGTTVHVRLPLRREGAMTRAPDRVLIVDDEARIRKIVTLLLREEGLDPRSVESGEACLRAVAEDPPDLVLMDLTLPGRDGLETMACLRAGGWDGEVVMMTAYGSVATAVRAIQEGAFHYLEKPFDNDELLSLVRRALERRRLRGEVAALREQLDARYALHNVVGVSGALRAVCAQVRRVAPTQATVLVEGESGTGKELVVRALHNLSRRREGPFVALNCAALPASLVENELFGHEKGSFTDARSRYEGRFEQAGGGTLFLDDVSELPAEVQAKLLRVIQEREISRIGGTAAIPVDVRIVAATNRDLHEQVGDGAFREDLFHRLNVVSLRLPPLRERLEDLPLLVEHFLQQVAPELERPVEGVTPGAMDLLRSYAWPGNVRELENVIRGAAILCNGRQVDETDLPPRLRRPSETPAVGTLAERLAAVERQAIAEALAEEGHNRTRTAARLGITRKTLLAKISAYGLEAERRP